MIVARLRPVLIFVCGRVIVGMFRTGRIIVVVRLIGRNGRRAIIARDAHLEQGIEVAAAELHPDGNRHRDDPPVWN
jgi:hypothetical protein